MNARRTLLPAACIAAVLIPAGVAAGAGDEPLARAALDRTYLRTAIQGDRLEVRAGRLAQRRSKDADVRHLAEVLIRDHVESKRDAIELGREYGVQTPDEPTQEQEWALRVLRNRENGSFDRAYTAYELRDHQQDIDDAENEANHGSIPEFVEEAKEELPMLHRHLRLTVKTRHEIK